MFRILFAFFIIEGITALDSPAFAQSFTGRIIDSECMPESEEIYSPWTNPALTAGSTESSIIAGIRRGYLVRDLDLESIAMIVPVKRSFVMSMTCDYTGNTFLNQQQFSIGLSRKFGNSVSAFLGGHQTRFHQFDDYGNAVSNGFKAGISGNITSRLKISSLLQYPVGSRHDDIFLKRIEFGLGYKCSDLFSIESSAAMYSGVQPSVHLGFNYKPAERFHLRGGILIKPFSGYIGTTLSTGHFNIDLNATHHPVLGFTPGMGLRYSIKNSQK